MIDSGSNSEISLKDLKCDRVAGFVAAISEILLISLICYGEGTETERLRAWFESFLETLWISQLCTRVLSGNL